MTNSIHTAYVADSLTRIGEASGDYDTDADFAAFLLRRYRNLPAIAESYATGNLTTTHLDQHIKVIVTDHRDPAGIHC